MFLYKELPTKINNLEEVIAGIKESKARTLAKKIISYFKEEEKNLIKDDW